MERAGSSGNGKILESKELQGQVEVVSDESAATMQEFLTPYDLHRRWAKAISLKTLANWRSLAVGPPYSRIGGRVLYRLHDVVVWESQHLHRTRK